MPEGHGRKGLDGRNYASALIGEFNAAVAAEHGATGASIDGRVRVWFNPQLESKDFMIPGVLALLLIVMTVVLALPGLAPLFAPGSRAEAAIMGIVTRPDGSVLQIPGKVDRLAVDGDTVLVADFKSGPPPEPGDTPQAYVRQLALYRLALAPLWPGKRLRMLLIWTAGPFVRELDGALLDQAAAEAVSGCDG